MKERWAEFCELTKLSKQQQIEFLLSFIEEDELQARFEGFLLAAEQDHFDGEKVI